MPDADTARIVGLFKDACEGGQVRLQGEEAAPVPAREIPAAVASWYKPVAELTVYRLHAGSSSYLVLFSGLNTGPYLKKGCAVATKLSDPETLWTLTTGEKVDDIKGSAHPTSFEFTNASGGYKLTAGRIESGFSVIQVSFLGSDQLSQMVSDQSRSGPKPGNEN